MLYDIEFPENDGSCSDFLTEADCTKRRLVFDSSQSYCSWNPDTADSSSNCTYTEPNVTMNTVIYVVIFSLIFSSFIGCFVDKAFKILHAPLVKKKDSHSSVQVTPQEDSLLQSDAATGVSEQSSNNSKQILSAPTKPTKGLVRGSIFKVKSKVRTRIFVGEVPEEQRQVIRCKIEAMKIVKLIISCLLFIRCYLLFY